MLKRFPTGNSLMIVAATLAIWFFGASGLTRSAKLSAATQSWDSVGGGALGGSGTWSIASTNWWSGVDSTWVSGNSAFFGGTAGTVTLGGSQSASGLTFGSNTGYTLTGSTLNLAGASAISITSPTTNTISSVLTSPGGITIQAGTGQLTLTNSSDNFTGLTTISSGILQLGGGTTGQDSALANSGGIADNSALVYNLVGSQTASYSISGSGSLTKIGSGTVTLTNANTFTGLTTISAGTLQLGTGVVGQDGSLSNSGSGILDNSALFYNLAGSQTTAYSISGSGSLKKTGTGSLVFDAANPYNGATTLSAGTLTLNGNPGNSGAISGTGTVTVGSVATLQVNDAAHIGGGLTLSGTGNSSIANINMSGSTTGALTVAGAVNFTKSTINMQLGSSGAVGTADEIVAGGGATFGSTGINNINFSTLAGQPVVPGTYTLITAASGLTSASTKFSVDNQPPGFYQFTLNSTNTALTLTISGAATPTNAYWTGAASQSNGDTANNWANGSSQTRSNWSTTSNGAIDPLQVPGSITNVIFTAANAVASSGTLSTQLDANTNYSINSLSFNTSANTNSINSFVLGTNGNLLTIGSGGLSLSGTSGATISGNGSVAVNGSQSWANNSNTKSLAVTVPVSAQSGLTTLNLTGAGSGGVTLTGALSNGGGTLALSDSQAGVTRLSGSNTYTGGTTLSTGTLNINSDAALGTAPATTATNVSLAGNATLQFAAPASLAATRGLAIGSGVTATLDTQGNSVTIGGPISGNGNLTQVGAGGTLIFSNSNSYTGTTAISAGTLQLGTGVVGQDGFLATSGITDNSVLAYNVAGAQTAAYGIGGTGRVIKTGTGSVTLTGSNGYAGSTAINGGLLEAITPAALANYSSGTVSVASGATLAVQMLAGSATSGWTDANLASLEGNSKVTFAPGSTLGVDVVGGGAYSSTASFAIGGSSLNKLGAGSLILLTPQSYSTATMITAGTLQLGNGTSGHDSSLASSSIIDNGNLVYNLFNNQTYSGAISGVGGLATTGSSALTLSGSNIFSGSTTVSGGTLMVNGSLSPTGAVTVFAGGTLGGSGSAGNATVANGGVINVSGNPTGTALYLSGLTLGQGSLDTSTLDFNSGSFQLSPELVIGSNGLTTKSGTVTVNVSTSLAVAGTYSLATFSGGSIGGAGSSVFTIGTNSGLTAGAQGTLLITNSALEWVVGSLNLIWTGSNSTQWIGGNNWKRSDNGATTDFVAGTNAVFNDSAGAANTNVTIGGSNVNTSGAIFNNNIYPYTISGPFGIAGAGGMNVNGSAGVTLATSNSYSGITTINGGTLQLGNGGATGSIAASSVTDNSVLAIALSGNVSLSSLINGPLSGSGSLAQLSGGTLTLSGQNNYTGNTIINAGVLSVSSSTNLGPAPATVVPNAISINGGELQFTSINAFNTPTLSSNSGMTLGASGGTINVPTLASGTFATNEATVQLRGIIAGSGGLTVTGGNTTNSGSNAYILELGAQNTYRGTTTVNNAIVAFNNGVATFPNALPTTTVLNLVNNGWFDMNNNGAFQTISGLAGDATGILSITNGGSFSQLTITPTAGATYNFPGVVGAQTILGKAGNNAELALAIGGQGTQIFSGVNTYSNSTSIASGTLQLGSGGATGSIAASTVTDNGALAVALSGNVALNTVISGAVTGSGVLIQMGPGMLMLTTTNSYSGGTRVSGGTLQLDSAGAIGTGGLTANGGLLDLNGNSLSVPKLNGLAGTITSSLAGSASLSVAGGGNFSGDIEDDPALGAGTAPISLTLSGGTLILSGTNSYSGGTKVTAGELVDASNGAIPGGSSLTVGSGATLVFDSSQVAGPIVGSPGAAASRELMAVPEPSTIVLLVAAVGAWCGRLVQRNHRLRRRTNI